MSAGTTAAISMVGIGKRFPGVHALKNVSIEIKPGEVVGLIGENGAGKSTLLKVLNGIYQPDAGGVFVDGAPVRITSPRDAFDKGIAMVFQEQLILPNLTVAENIFLGRDRRIPSLRADLEIAHECGSRSRIAQGSSQRASRQALR